MKSLIQPVAASSAQVINAVAALDRTNVYCKERRSVFSAGGPLMSGIERGVVEDGNLEIEDQLHTASEAKGSES